MQPALDISQYQGAWQDYPCSIVMIKMSGGDNGLYMDSDAATNYSGAVADDKAVGGYHFVGWQMGSAQEASYFLKAMSPLAENDVYALDCENAAVDIPSDGPAYILDMVNYIHNAIGVWPLVYMNLSTLNSFDWDAVLANCGLWLADWAVSPTADIPTTATYVMQQYNDGPNYDHDEWFGTVAEFQAYGWHAAMQPPAPAPTPPAPTPPTPVPSPEPSPAPAPVPTPEPVPEPTPSPKPVPEPPAQPTKPKSWFARFINALVTWWRS